MDLSVCACVCAYVCGVCVKKESERERESKRMKERVLMRSLKARLYLDIVKTSYKNLHFSHLHIAGLLYCKY